MMSRSIFLLYSAFLILGGAGCRDEDAKSDALRDSSATSRMEERARLESEFSQMTNRLDSLWQDSLVVAPGMRGHYLRTLRDAHTAKDNTKVFLDELKVSPQGVTPAIWEGIRTRARLSLDTLRRLLVSADSTHKLQSSRPRPE